MREGMKVAKAKGRLRGKPPKLKPSQEAHLAELFAVARSTVYRAIRRAGEPIARCDRRSTVERASIRR